MAGVLAGKIALVTGASSGIGAAAAEALASAGATVVIAARRVDRLEALVKQIESRGGKAFAVPGDVTDEETALGLVTGTVSRFGRLDILVNSAGVIDSGGIENADMARYRRVVDINLLGSLYTCHAAIGPMRASSLRSPDL